jgi:Mn-dependent DtxR family transcriptional regulator
MNRENLYIQYWLRAYYQLRAGASPRRRVTELVHDQIKDILTEQDYKTIPSGDPNSESDVSWRKAADWCHTRMARAGLIEQVSHGVWRLTSKGLVEAERPARETIVSSVDLL